MQLDGEPRLLWIQGAACVRSFGMIEVAFCLASCTVLCQVGSLRRRVEELQREADFDAVDTAAKQQDFSWTPKPNTARFQILECV